jgi:hypothetical protein
MSTPTSSSGGYEFTAEENKKIEQVAFRANLYGVVSTVTGALLLLFGGALALTKSPLAGLGLVALSLVPLLSGRWYRQAATALGDVVKTQGNDIALMMTALHKVTEAIRLEVMVTVFAFVVGIAIGGAMLSKVPH